MRTRTQHGSVVFDARRKTWAFLWRVKGQRRSKLLGTKRELPTKTAAWRAAEPMRRKLVEEHSELLNQPQTVATLKDLVQHYRVEKMPKRLSTKRSYEMWLRNHILPRWGDGPITDVQARPAELWLSSLDLAPKSVSHVRGMLHILWDYAMWRGDVPTQRNPLELVTVKNATKRTRKPRSLTVEQFQRFVQELHEPFRTIALLCVCFGLRISECLALKWSDVDWLNGTLRIERGIVRQHVDDVKTVNSERAMRIDAELLAVLKAWHGSTQFSGAGDWIFASPVKLGRLPFSYTGVLHIFQKSANRAGIGTLGTHTMRHSYRSWLDAVGTPVAVQQKLMRHADIRTTMNIYGDVVTDEMAQATSKIAGLALNGSQSGSQHC